MFNNNKEQYWENVHSKKSEKEVSWFQKYPIDSIELIKSLNINLNANIIDVGAGESRLVDNLIELGFTNIDVLDISKSAIEKAKQRLGKKSLGVNWIVSDINEFVPIKKYDLWHDRAAFHFLTNKKHIKNYISLTSNYINNKGKLIIATFSSNGPIKCSGLDVVRYGKESIEKTFENTFNINNHFISSHKTPFSTFQEFLFASFEKK
jgi:2-polyprenyl-3-methyl-5-hydroxy-6-metoxy-1,4-benzoquinol methylase